MIDFLTVKAHGVPVRLRRRGLRLWVRWNPAGWYWIAADAPGAWSVAFVGRWRPVQGLPRWQALAEARAAAETALKAIRGALRAGAEAIEVAP